MNWKPSGSNRRSEEAGPKWYFASRWPLKIGDGHIRVRREWAPDHR